MIVGLRPGLANLSLSSLLAFSRPGFLFIAASVACIGSVVDTASAVDPPTLDAQLQARGIRDQRVLAAFANVSRDVFVPADAPERAFDDKPLPSTFTQVISQPYLLARMVEALQLKPGARVLEVGTGTGYPAAILSEVAAEVFSVGPIPETASTARLRLARSGRQNVHVKLGEGGEGWREYGPYDAILVSSFGPRVPPPLVDQLIEGGVLVMAVGPPRGRQVLLRGVKKGFKLHAKELAELNTAGAGAPKRDGSPRDGRRTEPSVGVREQRPPRDSDDSRSDR